MKRILVGLMVAAMLCSALGCSDSDIKKASKAAAGIASSLQAAESEVEKLTAAGELSHDDARQVVEAIREASVANDQLVAQVRSAKKLGNLSRANLGPWFASLSNSISALQSGAVLHISNAASRQKLQVILASADAAVSVLGSLIAGK